MIRENLSGKRIAVTGSTGFLGTALVERFLRTVPDCDLVLIVRPGRRGAQNRVNRDILKNDAFDRLRNEYATDPVSAGGLDDETFDEMCERRIFAIEGDVGQDGLGLDDNGLTLMATVDIAVHSAATVSFDSALDDAVQVNLLGPGRVAAVLRAAAAARTEPTSGGLGPGEPAYLVAVSTCYVAGSRRGNAPEQMVQDSPFFVEVDWRAEVDNAFQARKDTEQASRTPERLRELEAEATQILGAAGTPLIAERVENLRQKWVGDRMTQSGRARASSLGFPDAYAFTKALGEQALTDVKGPVPVSIVRPSIIESALAEPKPGWIRGFRMAEPVIISYARGLLKEFPGVPEGTVDVIPVDIVVAAIIAVAAAGPERCSRDHPGGVGRLNPLKYRPAGRQRQGWFTEHPVYDAKGQPIVVPEWTFPGAAGSKASSAGPSRCSRGREGPAGAAVARQAGRVSAQLERSAPRSTAAQYVELYGLYTECEAIYQVDNLMLTSGRARRRRPRDVQLRSAFGRLGALRPDIHLPSIVQHARVKTTPGARRRPTGWPAAQAGARPEASGRRRSTSRTR